MLRTTSWPTALLSWARVAWAAAAHAQAMRPTWGGASAQKVVAGCAIHEPIHFAKTMYNNTHLLARLGLVSALAIGTLAAHAAQPSPEIKQMLVGRTNVYLIKSDPMVLIDGGGKEDLAALQAGLKAEG